MTEWRVPLTDVSLGAEEIDAVGDVLKSGWLSMGPRTKAFEEAWAHFLGVPHALAVANGTAALHLAGAALGLGPGDEVLCPALTFVATANAILYTGARPVFVDIGGPDDLNLSVAGAARKVDPPDPSRDRHALRRLLLRPGWPPRPGKRVPPKDYRGQRPMPPGECIRGPVAPGGWEVSGRRDVSAFLPIRTSPPARAAWWRPGTRRWRPGCAWPAPTV